MGNHRIVGAALGVAPEQHRGDHPPAAADKRDNCTCKFFSEKSLQTTAYTVMIATMRTIAGRFRAAADETRLQILALLDRHGELCVCDVERTLRISQSKASRHLRYLVSRGFLADRPAGVWVHYRIKQQLEPTSAAVLAAVRIAFPKDALAELDRRLASWRASAERPAETPPQAVATRGAG